MKIIYFLVMSLLFISCGNGNKDLKKTYKKLPDNTSVNLSAPEIKVYLENSGSMDGYVKGVTDFENAVYSYISDIKLADLGKNHSKSGNNIIRLNYINSEVIEFKSDIKEFIDKLEPSDFKQRGGNRGKSDMSDIIDSILTNNCENNVSIFVSDCIFSPGKDYKKNDDADDYLNAQQIGIKNNIASRLKKDPDLAIVVYRLISQFDGFYYNRMDYATYIKNDRPFFIWLIGNKQHLNKILHNVNTYNIKGSGVKNTFSVSSTDKNINYGIIKSMSIGKFYLDREDPKSTIIEAKPESKGGKKRFVLAVGIDLSNSLLEDDYITDINNYVISDKSYKIEIHKNKKMNSHYSHVIKLISSKSVINKKNLEISLKNTLPSWINTCTDEEGLDINKGNSMLKTYGLKYLLGGVYEAFTKGDKNPKYFTLRINIK